MGRAFVCKRTDLQPGMVTRVDVDGIPVGVYDIDGTLFALGDVCPHEEAYLSEGYVDEDTVECPKHGSVFHIPSGDVRSLPATRNARTFAVIVDGDDVFVEA